MHAYMYIGPKCSMHHNTCFTATQQPPKKKKYISEISTKYLKILIRYKCIELFPSNKFDFIHIYIPSDKTVLKVFNFSWFLISFGA